MDAIDDHVFFSLVTLQPNFFNLSQLRQQWKYINNGGTTMVHVNYWVMYPISNSLRGVSFKPNLKKYFGSGKGVAEREILT